MMNASNFSIPCVTNEQNITVNGTDQNSCGSYDMFYNSYPENSGYELYMAINNFIEVAVLVIFAVGFPLNTLSFYIFTKSSLKNTSSSRYIAAISVVDNGVLITQLLSHLNWHFQVQVFRLHGACQFIMYFNFMCIFLSTWFIMALVTDKFIGLYWPVKRSDYCTVFRAKCVTIVFAIFSVVFYHHVTWTLTSREITPTLVICVTYSEAPGLARTYAIFNKLDYIIVAIIPYICLGILLCLIIAKICKHNIRNSDRMLSIRNRNLPSIYLENEFKTMPLVIAIAVATVGLGILHNCCRIFEIVNPVVFSIANFMWLFSFACKFFLFLTTSGAFRMQLLSLARQKMFQLSRNLNCSTQAPDQEMCNNVRGKDNNSTIECIIEGTV